MMTLIEPRPYRTTADLEVARQVLILGLQSGEPTHYVHVGDLAWWLFYLNQDYALADHLFLWDDPGGGAPRGWALLSPHYGAFDVFARPDQWRTGAAQAMFGWAEAQIEKHLAGTARTLRTMWVAEHDLGLIVHLESRGFVHSSYALCHTAQPLARTLAPAALPPGYVLRAIQESDEAEARAAAGHAAFGSALPLDRYIRRYRTFMASPVYAADLDVVAVAPDGQIAAFCIAWTDPVTRVGLLEPVGVHPDFRRRGLGRAVVQEALRRLQACGMVEACVNFEVGNSAARALYLAAGFTVQYRIFSYERAVKTGG